MASLALSLVPRSCQRLAIALCNLRLILTLPYFRFTRERTESEQAEEAAIDDKGERDGGRPRLTSCSTRHSLSRSRSRGRGSLVSQPSPLSSTLVSAGTTRGLHTTAAEADPNFAELYPPSTSSTGRTLNGDKERRRKNHEETRSEVQKDVADRLHVHNPVLFAPVRAPRNPVVLCHGMPCLRLHSVLHYIFH
jgi:hypothetical protein